MAVADFLNRTFDVLAWRGAELGIEVQPTPSLLDEESTGEICTGIQKLAQRFLIELLTPLGSIHYFPLRGTSFLPALLTGNSRLSADIFAAFSISEVEARTNLLAEETDDDPADERYDSCKLLQVDLQPSMVKLTIQMKSKAGTTLEFIPAIPIVP